LMIGNRSPTFPLSLGVASVPLEGEGVSVELALNSRCTSDYDGDPDIFHWGMFDSETQLPADVADRIVRLANRCSICQPATRVEARNNVLTFFIDSTRTADQRELYMIGSGMQQQAVSLACGALGVGMVFRNLGLDGGQIVSGRSATIEMHLGPMKPSYDGKYWTASSPKNERPWLPGNLPVPRRDGLVPLIRVLETVSCERHQGAAASRNEIGQVLWAARGRTPHLYKSTPWGMTIPTWAGLQNISALYVTAGSELYRYVNWQAGRPTHSLSAVVGRAAVARRLAEAFPNWNCFLVLASNDPYARGLWEVGYQVLNVLVQAWALDVACEVAVIGENLRRSFAGLPIERPAAIVGLRTSDENLS